ncbi:Iron uptake system component EfeO [Mycolicibacterium vanbaalenii]|uniref:Iron uptake system component EfeO n=1 Tax=Mycolicibacterium vanbaalenii TaxID=110539 RepID=A0A5S9R672_MYCVN|nr:iron uptake system protein EfeO [Mycolicibacterium vanbaalenii]CAA0132264.1 Iron uptake system component EfeO [Mycolicibacterium vanbaalenii]
MRRLSALPLSALALGLALAGCSSSGTDTTATETGTASETSETSASPAAPADPLVTQAAEEYQAYAVDQTNQLVTVVKTFTDAVRAGDLQAAQAAYAPSRVPWERIEPLAGLVEEIDGLVDARVDDFAGVDDPAFTGWHRLEYLLFDQNTTDGGAPFADQLDADIATLNEQMPTLEVAPSDVAVGAAELIEEVSEGKITGEENRYAKTDLWDFNANIEGSQAAIEELTPALQQADPALLEQINAGFAEVNSTLEPLRQGDGWVLYCTENDQYPSPRCPEVTVDQQTIDTLKAQLAGLSENVSQVAGVLNLQ